MTGAEVAKAVRLRRLVVWLVTYEQWQIVESYADAMPDRYIRTEWRARPAIVFDDALFQIGR